MRKLAPLLILILLACAGAAFFFAEEQGVPKVAEGNTELLPEKESPDFSGTDDEGLERASTLGDVAFAGGANPSHPFPAVAKSRDRLSLDGDPFIAESKEEQRWLDRNGYPNSEQWTTYSSAPDHLLKQAADAGDRVAYVMLAGRSLAKGDKGAVDNLLQEARSGSNFAIMTLASYMGGSQEGDIELGYALSRVAEMRGDYRIAVAREGMFPRALTQEQRLKGEAKALSIFAKLRDESRVATFVDPRPIGK